MTKLFNLLKTDSKLALEMINFQSDSYAKDIENEFNKLIEGIRYKKLNGRKLKGSPSVKKIEELTFNRTGVKIELITNSYLGACIPFYPNPYSAIVPRSVRGLMYDDPFFRTIYSKQVKLLESQLEHVGTVDVVKCKVTGLFSKYINPIFINLEALMNFKLDSSEITSIFLHELGHCFTAYEYSNRLNSTNQVLSQLMKEQLNKDKLDKNYLFKELKVINHKLTSEELDKIIDGENTILGHKTLKFIKETVQSQMQDDWYDETGNETLADNFVTRWHYGIHITTALDKLGDGHYLREENSLTGATLGTLNSIAAITYLTFGLTLLIKAAQENSSKPSVGACYVAAAAVTSVILFATIISHSKFFMDMTYDDVKNRYKRIRNQLVELLKHTEDLSAEQIQETIGQIKTLDNLVDERGNYRNLVGVIVDLLRPSSYARQASLDTQRLLEELSANELYVKAASLSSLS